MIVVLSICYVLAFVVAWIGLLVWAASQIDDPMDDTVTPAMLALIGAALWPVTIVSLGVILGARWALTRVWMARYGHLIPTQEPEPHPASAPG